MGETDQIAGATSESTRPASTASADGQASSTTPVPQLARRLSPQDNFFLLFETEEAPLNIGSVGVFEGKIPFDGFVEMVRSKMHLVPRYRQRVIPAPLGISRPTWEDDPHFDLSRHIRRVTIDPPGTHAQLMDLTARLYEGRLDRSKPLWELTVIEGLENDQTAVFSKVHHCLVDGVSGIALLLVTMDVLPDPPPPVVPAEPFEPEPIPDRLDLLADALRDNALEALERSFGLQRGLLELTLGRDTDGARKLARAAETTLPYLTTAMQKAPFNGRLSGRRRFAGSGFAFDEVRAIRKASGGTVNDVVLTVLGGALGRYLELHGYPTKDQTLRVMTPVNVRSEDPQASLGNQISALIADVPVGISDPVKRLQTITEMTKRLKESHTSDGNVTLFDQVLSLPPPLLSSFISVLPPNSVVNMVCTNVPGPMIPLYSAGHKMLAGYPIVPLAWEMGLGCAVMSYDHSLYFGLMADVATAPDVARLKGFLEEAYQETRMAAGVETTHAAMRPRSASPATAT